MAFQHKCSGRNRCIAFRPMWICLEYFVWQFPDSAEGALTAAGVGHSGVSAMTHKVITFEFVVPTALAIALGIALSVGAVYFTAKYLFPVDQLEANYPHPLMQ
jgi:hypothetical protein